MLKGSLLPSDRAGIDHRSTPSLDIATAALLSTRYLSQPAFLSNSRDLALEQEDESGHGFTKDESWVHRSQDRPLWMSRLSYQVLLPTAGKSRTTGP